MTKTVWWACVAILLWPSDGLAGQSIAYEGGLSFSTGNYIFVQRTTSWSLTSGLAASTGPLTVRLTLPIYLQNTSLIAGGSTVPIPTGGSHAGIVRDSSTGRMGQGQGMGSGSMSGMTDASIVVPGAEVTDYSASIGDPLMGTWLSFGNRTSLTVGIGVKPPVADTSSFGTGQWDFGGSIGLSRIVGLSWMVSVDASYWRLGDMPELDLRDLVSGSVSSSYLSRAGWGASLSVAGSRSVIEEFADPYSVNGSISRIGAMKSIGMSISIGVTETAPDIAASVFWRVGLTGTS